MATNYRKIPKVGSGRGGLQVGLRTRMYAAADHLLIVQSSGYFEEYKRIFFRDVRYVDVRKNKGQLWLAIVSAVFLLLFFLLYFARVPGAVVTALCLPFATWFVVNLFGGPTCECYVTTSVQTLKLPAPRRQKKIATFINFLRAQTAPIANATQP